MRHTGHSFEAVSYSNARKYSRLACGRLTSTVVLVFQMSVEMQAGDLLVGTLQIQGL